MFEAVVNVDLGFLESFTLIPIVRAPMTPKDFLLDELVGFEKVANFLQCQILH